MLKSSWIFILPSCAMWLICANLQVLSNVIVFASLFCFCDLFSVWTVQIISFCNLWRARTITIDSALLSHINIPKKKCTMCPYKKAFFYRNFCSTWCSRMTHRARYHSKTLSIVLLWLIAPFSNLIAHLVDLTYCTEVNLKW